MVRIVTDFVQTPSLLVLCDNKNCGCFATFNLDPNPVVQQKQSQQVVAQLIQSGWSIGILGSWCSGHVAEMAMEQKNAEPKRITVASSMSDVHPLTLKNGRSN